jgi:predicted DNA-binding protein
MLSVRLPDPLESQLAAYCESAGLSKSAVVQAALEKHLKKLAPGLAAASGTKRATKDLFLALLGSGNRKYSTDQIMRMTRGDDLNQP